MEDTDLVYTQLRMQKHTLKWIVYPLIASIGFFFFALSMSNLYSFFNGDFQSMKIPFVFYLNTFVVILSSVFLHYSFDSFKNEKVYRSYMYLIWTVVFGFIFIMVQWLGWMYMSRNAMPLRWGTVGVSYFYLISILHILHVLAGFGVLIYFFFRLRKIQGDEVQYVLQVSNPFFIEKYRLAVLYWHFVGIIWLYMILFFSMLQ